MADRWMTYTIYNDTEPDFVDAVPAKISYKYVSQFSITEYLVCVIDDTIDIEDYTDYLLEIKPLGSLQDFDKIFVANRQVHYTVGDFDGIFTVQEYTNIMNSLDPVVRVFYARYQNLRENDINLTDPRIQQGMWYLWYTAVIDNGTYLTMMAGVPPV